MTWHWIAERRIEAALAAGEFENLEGEGSPLPPENDTGTDPSWRLAHHVLRNAGLAPAWIELHQEVRQGLLAARLELARAAREFGMAEETPGWKAARMRFERQVEILNRLIEQLNWRIPSGIPQRSRVDAARECERVRSSTNGG